MCDHHTECCPVVGARGPPGPRGPRGPPGLGTTGRIPVGPTGISCSSVVSYNTGSNQFQYGPIQTGVLTTLDSIVFCKNGILSQGMLLTPPNVPQTASLVFSDAANLSLAPLRAFTQTDCNYTYLQTDGSVIGYKQKARLFQLNNVPQTLSTAQAPIDFTSSGYVPATQCLCAPMSTQWVVPFSAIYSISLQGTVVNVVNTNFVNIQLYSGATLLCETSSPVFSNSLSTVTGQFSLSWIGSLSMGNIITLRPRTSFTATYAPVLINIVEL